MMLDKQQNLNTIVFNKKRFLRLGKQRGAFYPSEHTEFLVIAIVSHLKTSRKTNRR